MKKFNFKLKGLLKIREFEESKAKIALGETLKEIAEVKEGIAKKRSSIEETYRSQEALLADPASAQMLQFYPHFIEGLKEDIKAKENLLFSLEKKYHSQLSELNKRRGEVKVIENFKEKEHQKFKRKLAKEEQEKIEDILTMKRFYDKVSGGQS